MTLFCSLRALKVSIVNFFFGGLDRIIKEADFVVVVGERFQDLSGREVFLFPIVCLGDFCFDLANFACFFVLPLLFT